MMAKKVDRDLCDLCGQCIRICSNSRVIEADAQGFPRFAREHQCIQCGHCLAICPRGAISFGPETAGPEHPYAAGPLPAAPQPAPDGRAAADLLFAVRSSRAFEDRAVERGKLERILEAMVRSPSAGNEQNRSFYVLDSKGKVDGLEADTAAHFRKSSAAMRSPLAVSLYVRAVGKSRAKGAFSRNTLLADMPKRERAEAIRAMMTDLARRQDAGEISYFHGAPTAFLVTSRTDAGEFHKSFHKADVAIAVTYGTIMAAGLGLAACWMGLAEMAFRTDGPMRVKYGIPGNERVDAVLAVGYSSLRWKQVPPRGPVKAVWR